MTSPSPSHYFPPPPTAIARTLPSSPPTRHPSVHAGVQPLPSPTLTYSTMAPSSGGTLQHSPSSSFILHDTRAWPPTTAEADPHDRSSFSTAKPQPKQGTMASFYLESGTVVPGSAVAVPHQRKGPAPPSSCCSINCCGFGCGCWGFGWGGCNCCGYDCSGDRRRLLLVVVSLLIALAVVLGVLEATGHLISASHGAPYQLTPFPSSSTGAAIPSACINCRVASEAVPSMFTPFYAPPANASSYCTNLTDATACLTSLLSTWQGYTITLPANSEYTLNSQAPLVLYNNTIINGNNCTFITNGTTPIYPNYPTTSNVVTGSIPYLMTLHSNTIVANITLASSIPAHGILLAPTASNILLSNLTFAGLATLSLPDGSFVGGTAITWAGNNSNVEVAYSAFTQLGYGLLLSTPYLSNTSMHDNVFTNTRADAISISAFPFNNPLARNTWTVDWLPSHMAVYNNVMRSIGGGAHSTQPQWGFCITAAGVTDVLVQGNDLSGCSWQGVRVGDASVNVRVLNNRIDSVWGNASIAYAGAMNGVEIGRAAQITVAGNTFTAITDSCVNIEVACNALNITTPSGAALYIPPMYQVANAITISTNLFGSWGLSGLLSSAAVKGGGMPSQPNLGEVVEGNAYGLPGVAVTAPLTFCSCAGSMSIYDAAAWVFDNSTSTSNDGCSATFFPAHDCAQPYSDDCQALPASSSSSATPFSSSAPSASAPAATNPTASPTPMPTVAATSRAALTSAAVVTSAIVPPTSAPQMAATSAVVAPTSRPMSASSSSSWTYVSPIPGLVHWLPLQGSYVDQVSADTVVVLQGSSACASFATVGGITAWTQSCGLNSHAATLLLPSPTEAGDVTLCTYINLGAQNIETTFFFSCLNVSTSAVDCIEVWHDANYGVLAARINQGGLGVGTQFVIPGGQWFHVCATYSPSAQLLVLYYNGNNVGQVTVSHSTSTYGAPVLAGQADDSTAVVQGSFVNFRYYQAALTADQVASLTVTDKPGYSAPKVDTTSHTAAPQHSSSAPASSSTQSSSTQSSSTFSSSPPSSSVFSSSVFSSSPASSSVFSSSIPSSSVLSSSPISSSVFSSSDVSSSPASSSDSSSLSSSPASSSLSSSVFSSSDVSTSLSSSLSSSMLSSSPMSSSDSSSVFSSSPDSSSVSSSLLSSSQSSSIPVSSAETSPAVPLIVSSSTFSSSVFSSSPPSTASASPAAPSGPLSRFLSIAPSAATSLVRVSVIGDSISWGLYASNPMMTSWVGLLRGRLQSVYGDGGSGFTSVTFFAGYSGGSPYYFGSDVGVSLNGAWGLDDGGCGNIKAYDDLNAVAAWSETPGVTAQFYVRGAQLTLFYVTHPTGPAFSVQLDGSVVLASVNTSDPNTASVSVTLSATSGWHTLTVTHTGQSGQRLLVQGVDAVYPQGMVVDMYATPGQTAENLACSTHTIKQAGGAGGLRPASLVLVELGINDAVSGVSPADFGGYLADISSSFMGVDSVFMRFSFGGIEPDHGAAAYAAYLQEVPTSFQLVFDVGTLLFNGNYTLGVEMGLFGYFNNPGWGDTNMGSVDAVHPSDLGHLLSSNLLCPALNLTC